MREVATAIFISEKLDKLNELVDAVNNLTINNTKYFESNTATASDAQSDLTHNPETATCTSNCNETVHHTSNGNFEQTILSNQTIPVVFLTMNPSIDQSIDPIVIAPQTLLMTTMKEVVSDAALGDAWVNKAMWQISWTGVNGSTPGNILNAFNIKHDLSPILIEMVSIYPPCGLDVSLRVANKPHSNTPGFIRQTRKLDAVVVGKLPNDLDSSSIFSKLIGHKLSNGSI